MVSGAGAAALGLGGCTSPEAQRAADSNSILAVFSPPKPADAARWSQDPSDPDKRLRGTSLLANAPFGGEESAEALMAEADAAMYREKKVSKRA